MPSRSRHIETRPVSQREAVREILLHWLLAASALMLGLCGGAAGANKALKGDLERQLDGKSLVCVVPLGGTGAPRGYTGDYPVNTIVSAEGQVSYRVEWGLMRSDVGLNEMRETYARGTRFKVVGLDLKDDRLELKLESDKGGSAKLKLMLGAGWQGRMDSTAVLQGLSHALVDSQQYRAQQPVATGGTPADQRAAALLNSPGYKATVAWAESNEQAMAKFKAQRAQEDKAFQDAVYDAGTGPPANYPQEKD
jgi:hypothetical protein